MVRRADDLVVRDHDRHAELAPDAEALLERVEHPVAFVAHVRAVEPPCFAQRPADLDDFLGRRGRAPARSRGRSRRRSRPAARASSHHLPHRTGSHRRAAPARRRPWSQRAASSARPAARRWWRRAASRSVARTRRRCRKRNQLAFVVEQVERRRDRRAHAPSGTGASEMPQLPATTVVTPWLTFGAISGADSIRRSSCVCASMKPGATIFPPRRSRLLARAPASSPMRAIGPPDTATSAANRGARVPSIDGARCG